jgi:hypothetical protein
MALGVRPKAMTARNAAIIRPSNCARRAEQQSIARRKQHGRAWRGAKKLAA